MWKPENHSQTLPPMEGQHNKYYIQSNIKKKLQSDKFDEMPK